MHMQVPQARDKVFPPSIDHLSTRRHGDSADGPYGMDAVARDDYPMLGKIVPVFHVNDRNMIEDH